LLTSLKWHQLAPKSNTVFHNYQGRGLDERTYSTLNLIVQSIEEAFSGKLKQKQSEKVYSEIDRCNDIQSTIAKILRRRSLDWKT